MKTIVRHKFYTLEEVLKNAMKRPGFKEGYEKELARLQMVGQIKEVRLKKKMSQAKLAKKADMPQSVIARIENGKQGLSFSTVSRIASALGKKIQLV